MNRDIIGYAFRVGDHVRVRTRPDIADTLDPLSKLDGCLFMEQMWEYCGQTFKVTKIVRNILDERRYEMFQPKAPLYILDGLVCNGHVSGFKNVCDHSCFFIWHEKWLTKD